MILTRLNNKPKRFDIRSWIVLLAALLSVGLTARLGFWQLDRAAQKEALQLEFETRSAMPVLAQRELTAMPQDAPGFYQRRVTLRGQWLASATVFLDNRQMGGRQGFFVLTPLRLQADPNAQGMPEAGLPLIWVQRGWVVRDNNDRSRLPDVPTPPGLVDVQGRVAPPPARLFEFDADVHSTIRQNLDLAESARELAQPVLPMTVLQTEAPATGPDGLQRLWPAPSLNVQRHYGYAFQWMALCFVIIGLYVWFQIIRPNRYKNRERD